MYKKLFNILFHKPTSEELEEQYTEEIEEENHKELERQYENEIPASVIRYVPADDETSGVSIEVVIENFSAPIMPEPGAVIWCDVDGILMPFHCIRFDFICNKSELDSGRVYIVVEPATQKHIIPNPQFLVNEI